jgi:hypothetical protein
MSFLSNYKIIPDDLMDKYAANFYVSRPASSKARGLVRIYFTEPISIYISYLNEFVSNTGLSFYPVESQSISKEEMSSYYDPIENLYYVPVIVEAAEEGDQYNIPANSIVAVNNFPYAYTKITNDAFSQGTKKITNEEFYNQILDALMTREFITKPAIISGIKNAFNCKNVFPASFKDPVIVRSPLANYVDIYVDNYEHEIIETSDIPIDEFKYNGNFALEYTIDFNDPNFKLYKSDGTLITEKMIFDIEQVSGDNNILPKGMPFGYGAFGAYRFGYGELASATVDYYDIVVDPKTRTTTDEKLIIAIPASAPYSNIRLKIKRYKATDIQSFVNERAAVNLDMKVRLFQVAKLYLTLKIKGAIDLSKATSLISDYLESIPPGGTIEADDIISVLNENFRNIIVYFPFERFYVEIETLNAKKYIIEGTSTIELPEKIENSFYKSSIVYKLASLEIV